jgi:hypothetical protein
LRQGEMGILDNIFGAKEVSPEERADKSLAGLTIAMATFNGGVTMGEALKRKKTPNNTRTKRIKIAFAFGSFDFIAGENRMTQQETLDAFSQYIHDIYKKDANTLIDWFNKNYNKKNFVKIMNIGGQATLDFAKKRLKNQIILFSTLSDKKNKL